jgi:DNA mismatch endonuclease (patch repair protein)
VVSAFVCISARRASIPRRADVLLRKVRLAIFVDGCFWHGCPEHYRPPARREGYWMEKVRRNRERDKDTNIRLAAAGWTVLRFWEHERPEDCSDRTVALIVDLRRGSDPVLIVPRLRIAGTPSAERHLHPRL